MDGTDHDERRRGRLLNGSGGDGHTGRFRRRRHRLSAEGDRGGGGECAGQAQRPGQAAGGGQARTAQCAVAELGVPPSIRHGSLPPPPPSSPTGVGEGAGDAAGAGGRAGAGAGAWGGAALNCWVAGGGS